MKRRDIFQRKCTAAYRMSMAARRVLEATSAGDREKAGRWVAAWRAVSGIRTYRLGSGGAGLVKRPRGRR